LNHLKRISLFHILCALTALGVGLASCAPATGNPIDTATALAKPTEVAATVATETLEPATATATKLATATPEPTPTAKAPSHEEIIANAENRPVEFDYLNSPKYLEELKLKESRGELPKVHEYVNYVSPGTIDLLFDQAPSSIFKKYGVDGAIEFSDAKKWAQNMQRPWTTVDAGYTEIGKAKVGFFVYRLQNPDGSIAYLGNIFIPIGNLSTADEFKHWIATEVQRYPVPGMFTSSDGCVKFIQGYSSTTQDITDYCQLLGGNPESALPKSALRAWNKTGILMFNSNTIPWSQAMNMPIKY